MPRRPVEKRAGASDVELVMIVGEVDHPRLHEGVLVEGILLHPGARLSDRLRHRTHGPGLAVDQPADAPLEVFIARGLLLPEQDRALLGQAVAAHDDPLDSVSKIFQMEIRLSPGGVARKQVPQGLTLVNPRNLLRGKPPGSARRRPPPSSK
jgi:hypothetical protein